MPPSSSREDTQVDHAFWDDLASEQAGEAEANNADLLARLDAKNGCLAFVANTALIEWYVEKRQILWPAQEGEVDPGLVFTNMATNVLNSALAARRLATVGLDRQARTVMRELMEIGDLLLVITSDYEMFSKYVSTPDDENAAYKYWKENFKPYEIMEKLKARTREAGLGTISESSSEFWRRHFGLYAWLSKAVHVDYASLSVHGFASDYAGRYNLNLGGRVGSHTTTTLERLDSYLRNFLIVLSLFLARHHGWMDKGEALANALRQVRGMVETEYKKDRSR